MLSRSDIQSILKLAVHAPSGDNAQPWRFVVRGSEIDVFNVPGKDYSPYNFREKGSLLANGAVVENISLIASMFGYEANVTLFPDAEKKDHVAHIVFEKNTHPADPLAACIAARITNRKPYDARPLIAHHESALRAVVADTGFGELLFLKDRALINDFAKIVSLSDQLIFEEKSIHDAIFRSIRWTEQEEATACRMYIKTLELPPPAQLLFKLFRNWNVLVQANKINISKFIASQSAKNYATSSAMGILLLPEAAQDDDVSYVKIGRVFQRMWLMVTSLGLSLQPLAALPYLAARVKAGDAGELTEAHASAVVKAQAHIMELFGNPKGSVAMMFRLGYAKPPSAHSKKSEPGILYID